MSESLDFKLGRLITTQEAQMKQLDAIERKMDEAEVKRSAIYSQISKQQADIESLKKDMETVKPVAEEVRRWKLLGMGALGIVGIGGVAFGATFQEIFNAIGKFFRWN
jgi:hypothetical protein